MSGNEKLLTKQDLLGILSGEKNFGRVSLSTYCMESRNMI